MKYLFEAEIAKQGKGYAVNVPFNVWEVVRQREEIDAELIIEDKLVNCKLLPVDKGMYQIYFEDNSLDVKTDIPYELLLRVPSSLAPIEGKSPYSKENPIRKIDGIDLRLQTGDGLCGQACVAMLAGVTIEEVVNVLNCREWQGTMGKLISALDYYGIDHPKTIVYSNFAENVKLPKCCLMIEKLGRFGHYLVQYDGKFYDPNVGIMEEYDYSKLIGYLEIYV